LDVSQARYLDAASVAINETTTNNSPYNAISSLALDPTTIAISPEHLPELTPAAFKAIAPAISSRNCGRER